MLWCLGKIRLVFFFFFQAEDGIRDGRVTGVQTCALPISLTACATIRAIGCLPRRAAVRSLVIIRAAAPSLVPGALPAVTVPSFLNAGRNFASERTAADRKSTRLNSSHPSISYAVFCLKKK